MSRFDVQKQTWETMAMLKKKKIPQKKWEVYENEFYALNLKDSN